MLWRTKQRSSPRNSSSRAKTRATKPPRSTRKLSSSALEFWFPQARLWETSDRALLYEAPEEFHTEETGIEIEFQKATRDIADKGHKSIPEIRGEQNSVGVHARGAKTFAKSITLRCGPMALLANRCSRTKTEMRLCFRTDRQKTKAQRQRCKRAAQAQE